MTQISRRAILSVALGGGAALAVPAAAVEPTPISSGLLAAVAAYQAARAANEAYRTNVFEPMERSLFAEERLVPHSRTSRTYKSIADAQATLSTENVALARRAIKDARFVDEDYFAVAREVVALAEVRETRLREIGLAHEKDEIRARERALGSADTAAGNAVVLFPAASIADVMLKLRWITDQDWWEMCEVQEGITADLDRLQVVA